MSYKSEAKKATVFNLIINIFLFIIKLFAGIISNSIAIISDAINSFTDIVTSFIIIYSVRIGRKRADSDHPFGHHRAEPIAGLIIAIFASILGFEILRSSFIRFFNKEMIFINQVSFIIIIIAIFSKIFLTYYLKFVGKRERSPALIAASIDSRNDVLSSLVVLIGITGSYFGYLYFDSVAGIFIGFYIIKSGYDIARSNVDYLMGKSANQEFYNKLRLLAISIKGVQSVHNLKIHYVGNYFHAEIFICVNKNLKTYDSYQIANKVQKKIEKLTEVDKIFVHLVPI